VVQCDGSLGRGVLLSKLILGESLSDMIVKVENVSEVVMGLNKKGKKRKKKMGKTKSENGRRRPTRSRVTQVIILQLW